MHNTPVCQFKLHTRQQPHPPKWYIIYRICLIWKVFFSSGVGWFNFDGLVKDFFKRIFPFFSTYFFIVLAIRQLWHFAWWCVEIQGCSSFTWHIFTSPMGLKTKVPIKVITQTVHYFSSWSNNDSQMPIWTLEQVLLVDSSGSYWPRDPFLKQFQVMEDKILVLCIPKFNWS